MSGRMAPVSCPACGYRMDAFESLGHKERPRDGDVSVCLSCANPNVFRVFDGELNICEPTPAERAAFIKDDRVVAIITAIMDTREEHEAKEPGTWPSAH